MTIGSPRRVESGRTGRLARRLIGLLVVAVVVPTFIATSLSLATWRSAYRQAVLERQHEIAKLAANRVGSLLDVVIDQVQIVALQVNLSSEARLQQLATQLMKANWGVQEVLVADAMGRAIVRYDRYHVIPDSDELHVGDEQFFLLSMLDEVYVRDIEVSEYNEPLLRIAEPVHNADRAPAGVLAVRFNLKVMWDALAEVDAGDSGYALIVDHENRLIGHKNPSTVLRGLDLSDVDTVRRAARSEANVRPGPLDEHMAIGMEGEGVLFSAASICRSGWTAIVETPVDEAFVAESATLRWSIVVVLLSVLAGSFYARFAGLSFAKPIQALTRTARELGAGNLEARAEAAPPRSTPDEIDTLVASFNDMANAVSAAVAEERSARRALQESERSLNDAQRIARLGRWQWDLGSRHAHTTDQVHQILGTTRPDGGATVKELLERVHSEDLAALEARAKATLAGSTRFDETIRMVRPDGETRWCHALVEVVQDEDGRPAQLVGTVLDITERRQAEEALAQLNSELEARVAERTAELEAFAYSISHDLRAPLRAVQGFSEAVLEDYEGALDASGQDYLRRIVGAAARMDGLIQALLAYSRLSQTETTAQAVPLADIVAEARRTTVTDELEGKVHLTVHEPLPVVLAHPPTLRQVVTNLLSNAFKFVEPGTAPQVKVWAEPKGTRMRLWIEDNGIGINPEHHDRILQVFERLHGVEEYPGTGIGLAIVKKSVERMSGRVGLVSALGSGSRFWIELPTEESAGIESRVPVEVENAQPV